MVRPYSASIRTPWLLLAVLAQAGPGVGRCADLPPNPLRSEPVLRIMPAAATEESATQPPSVVPPSFGQPELLPAPADFGPVPGGMTAADLSGPAPFHNLVHPWLADPWFSHGDPNDPHRHIGLGQPLIGTSWRNRPWYFGTFIGGVMMDDLVPNKVYQSDTTFVGARLGYDFDHFWGMEGRWAFARPDLANGNGTPFFPASRDNFADVSLLYYPLGDARWRPYLLAGVGFTTFRFNNQFGQRISEAPLDVPLGFGLKYFYGPWFTLRFDVTDNLNLGNSRISGMHNLSLMTGAELRFGGRRPSYFPWHNNTSYP